MPYGLVDGALTGYSSRDCFYVINPSADLGAYASYVARQCISHVDAFAFLFVLFRGMRPYVYVYTFVRSMHLFVLSREMRPYVYVYTCVRKCTPAYINA